MNLFNFLNHGVQLNGGRQKSRDQIAAEEALSMWNDDLLSLQLFIWSNLDDPEYSLKVLRLTTILTLIGMAVTHRDKTYDSPFIRVLRGAISAVSTVNEDTGRIAVAVSTACQFASQEIPKLPWQSVIHAVTHLRKSHGL